MLYNASEAHLFRCRHQYWVGQQPILVPDSFSTLGVTTPSKGIDSLVQGAKHLKGTDVCHVAYSGARINCSFANAGTFPPVMDYHYESTESYVDSHGYWAGDQYSYVYTGRRFSWAPDWEHLIMHTYLNWDKPAQVTSWQSDWSVSRWQQERYIYVEVVFDAMYTGWITSSLEDISKAPHHHSVEKYTYQVRQIRYFNNGALVTESDGDPIGISEPGDWPDMQNNFFKLNEKFFFVEDICKSWKLSAPWYTFNQGPKASAFMKAVEGFPTLDSNSWANLLEIVGLLKDLKRGHFSKAADVPKKWYEWWLQYRYRYSTTKSDVESMAKLKENLQSFHESFGNYRRNVYGAFFDGDTGITWRCEVQAVNRAANQIEQIYHGFETLGFGLTIYNLWDLVPYSFVVDWIFPVGDVLESMQKKEYLSSDYWDFESICYSASYVRGMSNGDFALSATVYDRWYESSPPNLDQYYWFEEHSGTASTKTGIFRLIDGLSLLVAGRH